MGQTTYETAAGVLDIRYVEDSPSDLTVSVDTPGFLFGCTPEWICEQIEAGRFLLISLVDDDVIRTHLG
jgi:hypothetical protein